MKKITVKDLLVKLNEIVLICEIRIKKSDEDASVNAARSSALDKQAIDVEKANKIAKEGIERLNDLNVKHEELNNAKEAKKSLDEEIKRYKALQNELDAKFAEVEELKKNIMIESEVRKEKLQKEIDSLAEDKKDYKDQVMKAISSELKKKGIDL